MEAAGDGRLDYQHARIVALEAALREVATLLRYLTDEVAPDPDVRLHARYVAQLYAGPRRAGYV